MPYANDYLHYPAPLTRKPLLPLYTRLVSVVCCWLDPRSSTKKVSDGLKRGGRYVAYPELLEKICVGMRHGSIACWC